MTDTATKTDLPKAITNWDDPDLGLSPEILRGIYGIGFDKPSPIQRQGVPQMLRTNKEGRRRDLIAQAQSGTGKTGCFAVGSIEIVDSTKALTQALILAPTHELANQIKDVVTEMGQYCKIVVQLLVGGTSVVTESALTPIHHISSSGLRGVSMT